MPKSIKAEHTSRMFPFEFYDELSEHLKEFTLLNPAFFLKDELDAATDRKALFEKARKNKPMDTLNENNLIQVEPFGELLMLEVCSPAKDKETVVKHRDKRGQIPLSIIVAQLYDSTGAPVFAKDVTEETIGQIPEVLWDDPNLLLGVITFTQEEPRVAVIKIPKRIEEQFFESVDGSDNA